MSHASSRHLTGTGPVRAIRHGRPRRRTAPAPDPAAAVWAAIEAFDEVLGRPAQKPHTRPGVDVPPRNGRQAAHGAAGRHDEHGMPDRHPTEETQTR